MLIGIVGKAGAGKDTVADHLCSVYGYQRMSFAEPLKRIVGELFDMSHQQLHHQNYKEVMDERYGFTPRWLLQHFGTNVCRKLYPNIWVDYLMRKYKKMCTTNKEKNLPPPRVVVSDVRFLNEAEALNAAGGYIWRVVCPDNPKGLGKEGAAHASEMEQERIREHYELEAPYGQIPFLLKQADEALLAST